MKQFIEIKADTDDITVVKRSEITDEELKIIEPVFQAIKDFQPYTTEDSWTHNHNFPLLFQKKGEKSVKELYVETGLCTDEQILTFLDFCPDGDINNITDVDLIYVAHEEKLLETTLKS